MIYGLDNIILPPPFSFILSVFLLLGVDFLGNGILKILYRYIGAGVVGDFSENFRWQASLIGFTALSVFLYPLSLSGIISRLIFKIIGYSLFFLGFLNVMVVIGSFKFNLFKNANMYESFGLIIILMLLTFMFLSASGAITNADSLDYHIGVPIELLNEGKMPVRPLWFTSRLSGNGEILIAIGLSVGAEQFGSLIQFSGILAITGIFLLGQYNAKGRIIRAITALSLPVLLFLVTSPKPQMLQIAMITFAASLLLSMSNGNSKKEKCHFLFIVICTLCMTASQAKFSFLLGGGVIGILSFLEMVKKKLNITAVVSFVIAFFVIMVPPAIWKSIHFNSGFIEALITPFPGNLPGYNNFEAFLRNYSDSSIPFPLSLIFPRNFGGVSTLLGLGVVWVFFVRPGKTIIYWEIIIGAIIFIAFGLLMGQSSSRFFIEPIYWILLLPSVFDNTKNVIVNQKVLFFPIFVQVMITLLLFGYAVITLFPSAISSSFREKIMHQKAYGYSVMKWVDNVLPRNAIILSEHRSVGLSPRAFLSTDWTHFVDISSEDASLYKEMSKKKRPTHILYVGAFPYSGPFKEYIEGLYAGPFSGKVATRNPFNYGTEYKAYLFKVRF